MYKMWGACKNLNNLEISIYLGNFLFLIYRDEDGNLRWIEKPLPAFFKSSIKVTLRKNGVVYKSPVASPSIFEAFFYNGPSLQVQLGREVDLPQSWNFIWQAAIKITFYDRVNINAWTTGVLMKASGNGDSTSGRGLLVLFSSFRWAHLSLIIL